MSVIKSISIKETALLFLIAFLIRSSVFLFYVQHNERYCQSDSMDYHIGAGCIAHGLGMHRPDTGKPIFWRTPGYPAYLALFYNFFGFKNFNFNENSNAQKSSIWFQIFLSSLLPILIFFLSFTITRSYLISIISSWFSVFHLGFVLASTYLLTDALALLFFLLFLLFFYKSFINLFVTNPSTSLRGDLKITIFAQDERWETSNNKTTYLQIILSALALSLFTWMRPMGQFIAILSALIFFIPKANKKLKIKSFFVFLFCFFILIAPWYIRNYNLTGKIFFCPLFGPYLTVFSAPKIKSTIENIPLIESHRILSRQGGAQAEKDILQATLNNSNKVVCTELSSLKVALPIIFAHPFLFVKDWIIEVIKTTFDLYSSQLVNFAANKFKWDPLIEYLPEKIAECLWKQEMNIFMRLICWIEFLISLILWSCFFAGFYLFLLIPIFNWPKINQNTRNLAYFWLISCLIGLITVGMTGGFGYARLRLPIEPLFIILSMQSAMYFLPIVFKKLSGIFKKRNLQAII